VTEPTGDVVSLELYCTGRGKHERFLMTTYRRLGLHGMGDDYPVLPATQLRPSRARRLELGLFQPPLHGLPPSADD